MSSHIRSALMRRPQAIRFFARNASTTSEAASSAAQTASKAKEAASGAASTATSKASEGLSRVSSSGSAALSKAGSALSNAADALGKVGGRTGQVVGFVQSLIPPTIYYSKVCLELGKLIVNGRKMSPPDVATFQTYLQPIVNAAKNPSSLTSAASNPNSILSRVRNVDRQQLTQAGIVAAEVIGFFTVGEIIGRMKFIGYKPAVHAHGEH